MPQSRLLFEHQDGPLTFSIERASYNLSDKRLFSCSFECKLNEEFDYMSAPFFAAHNINSNGGMRLGQRLQVTPKYEQGQIPELPRVHLYTGRHYNPWDTTLEIVSVISGTIGIMGSFMTLDPNYYDARAKDTHVTFFATFVAGPASELWSPC